MIFFFLPKTLDTRNSPGRIQHWTQWLLLRILVFFLLFLHWIYEGKVCAYWCFTDCFKDGGHKYYKINELFSGAEIGRVCRVVSSHTPGQSLHVQKNLFQCQAPFLEGMVSTWFSVQKFTFAASWVSLSFVVENPNSSFVQRKIWTVGSSDG